MVSDKPHYYYYYYYTAFTTAPYQQVKALYNNVRQALNTIKIYNLNNYTF